MTESSFYQRLLAETAAERRVFQTIPVIRRALGGDVPLSLYLRYLAEAYHHVRYTCPLLAAALARCEARDGDYRAALLEYLEEERGHEVWILDDIRALGGDADAVAAGRGGPAVRIMVGYAYYMIEHVSPYALLGMVHVLEGMSVALADKAATAIARAAADRTGGDVQGGGFSYLISHGGLDQEHVAFFERLVDRLPDAEAEAAVIDAARIMYRLFGDVFRGLDGGEEALHHAA